MPVEWQIVSPSPYNGDWRASAYAMDGVRFDQALYLRAEGTFERQRQEAEGEQRVDTGRWRHERWAHEGKTGEMIILEAEGPSVREPSPEQWSLLSVTGCEGTNCLMVLRRLALASRNLPLLFYRVHR